MSWILCPTTPRPPQIQMLKAQPPVEGFGERAFKKVIKIKWWVQSGTLIFQGQSLEEKETAELSGHGHTEERPSEDTVRCTLSELQKDWMQTNGLEKWVNETTMFTFKIQQPHTTKCEGCEEHDILEDWRWCPGRTGHLPAPRSRTLSL